MKLLDYYDLIVLGDHPASLLGACLAAKLGFSVIILPVHSEKRVRAKIEGKILDYEPNWVCGLSPQSTHPWAEIFKNIPLTEKEALLIRSEQTPLQILTPNYRLNIERNTTRQKTVFQHHFSEKTLDRMDFVRALSASEAPIKEFWHAMPSQLTLSSLDQKNTDKHAQKDVQKNVQVNRSLPDLCHALRSRSKCPQWFIDEPFDLAFYEKYGFEGMEQLVRSLGYFFNHKDSKFITPFDTLVHWCAVSDSATFYGGMSGLREQLIRIAKRLGVHVPGDMDCHCLFVRKNEFLGVQPTGSSTVLSAKGCILGCSIQTTRELIDKTKSDSQPLVDLKLRSEFNHFLFSVSMYINSESVPTSMARRSVWSERGAPLLCLELADPMEYSRKEEGKTLLFLRTILPTEARSFDRDFQKKIIVRMFHQACEIIPFLEYHVSMQYPDPQNLQELMEIYPFEQKQDIPESIRIYDGPGQGVNTGIENLYLASTESYPELGTGGFTRAAIESIAMLAYRFGLRGPLSWR